MLKWYRIIISAFQTWKNSKECHGLINKLLSQLINPNLLLLIYQRIAANLFILEEMNNNNNNNLSWPQKTPVIYFDQLFKKVL